MIEYAAVVTRNLSSFHSRNWVTLFLPGCTACIGLWHLCRGFLWKVHQRQVLWKQPHRRMHCLTRHWNWQSHSEAREKMRRHATLGQSCLVGGVHFVHAPWYCIKGEELHMLGTGNSRDLVTPHTITRRWHCTLPMQTSLLSNSEHAGYCYFLVFSLFQLRTRCVESKEIFTRTFWLLDAWNPGLGLFKFTMPSFVPLLGTLIVFLLHW